MSSKNRSEGIDMAEVIDVTGLPEAVVRDIRQLVETLRTSQTPPPRPAPAAELPRLEGVILGSLSRREIYDDDEPARDR